MPSDVNAACSEENNQSTSSLSPNQDSSSNESLLSLNANCEKHVSCDVCGKDGKCLLLCRKCRELRFIVHGNYQSTEIRGITFQSVNVIKPS